MDLLLNYKLRKLTDEQIKYFIELDKKNKSIGINLTEK